MKLVGIILVVLGALALGVQGFGHLFRGHRADATTHTVAARQASWVQPVVGGIAVVSGLLLLAADGRQE